MMRVVSVASGNEVAAARILARSLAEHHPDSPLTVLVLPGVRPTLHPGEEPFELLEPAALGQAIPPGVPAPLRAALARALVVRHALDAGAERVLVLPPDAELRGPLDAIVRDTRSVLLVPRLLGGLPQDGERPDSRDLLDAGEIDDELVAVRRDERGLAFTDWWIERRREDAEAAAAAGGADARPAPSPLAAAFAGSRIPPTTSPSGTCTSARSRTRGSSASRAFAPTARGGSPSTRRARSCSTTRSSPRRAAGARRLCSTRAGWSRRKAPGAGASCPAAWSGTSGCGGCTRRRSRRVRTSATSTRRPARARSRSG
jgi:hypothetical protein